MTFESLVTNVYQAGDGECCQSKEEKSSVGGWTPIEC